VLFAVQYEPLELVERAVDIANGIGQGHTEAGRFRCSMMAIFRHLRSVHVHRDMGTYGAGGRLGCGEMTPSTSR
jgi:hypothetical protein